MHLIVVTPLCRFACLAAVSLGSCTSHCVREGSMLWIWLDELPLFVSCFCFSSLSYNHFKRHKNSSSEESCLGHFYVLNFVQKQHT
eukprot:UN08289